jgi:hypothetical protein
MARLSPEKSGTPSVTPRLRILMKVMIVLWSCRRPRHPGHAALVGCQRHKAALKENAGADTRTRDTAQPRRQTRTEIFVKYLWSALQTHLQGVDGATLATMAEKRRHRAAPFSVG